MEAYRRSCSVNFLDTDCFGRCRPSALLAFAQSAAGEHSTLLGAGREVLDPKGLFWAVVRNRMQITRLPAEGETVTMETWPMPVNRAAFPRSTVAYDGQGMELFRAVSLWVLMDRQSRTLVLPGSSGVEIGGMLTGNELTVPRSLTPVELEHSQERTVRYGELDRNGHMNNARYLDWVSDLLPASFHREHPVRDITVCYANEIREGQTAQLCWRLEDSGVLRVDSEGENGVRIFSAQVQF